MDSAPNGRYYSMMQKNIQARIAGGVKQALLAILGIQLGGRNMYKGIVSDRARMGVPLVRLEAKHIPQTITIMHRSSFLFLLMLWLGGLILDITFSWL